VHESGVSILSMEVDGGDLIAMMLLPSLVTGTVGGGTSLPHQREWLTALGCAGPGGGARFAEIGARFAKIGAGFAKIGAGFEEIGAGFAPALAVSTTAALVSGQFADAHQRLGRSRRVD
jgi:hydroxymethylglutaryl-CoA reductase (NADPH)